MKYTNSPFFTVLEDQHHLVSIVLFHMDMELTPIPSIPFICFPQIVGLGSWHRGQLVKSLLLFI